MAELADYYCEQYARSRGLRPSTVQAARGLLNKFVLPRMGTRKVADVQYAEIQRIHGDVQHLNGKYSANKFRAVLSRMFTLACKLKWRSGNPASELDKQNEEQRHTYLDRDQLDRLLAACDRHSDQNAANAIRLLVYTGARLREVLNASWTQFDLEKAIWVKPSHHTKTKVRHQVILANPVVALLRSMRERSISTEYLFPGTSLGAPRVDLKRPWASICEDAGLSGYRIHDLRRTFATFMLSSGSDLSAVGKSLGHTQASTTQRYASLLIEDQRDAANRTVEKMGGGLRVVA
jgi:integrase